MAGPWWGRPSFSGRAAEAQERRVPAVTECTKLDKVYTSAVAHLRQHLLMVALLGEANGDGDAALVHIEVERRAVDTYHWIVRRRPGSLGMGGTRLRRRVPHRRAVVRHRRRQR